MSDKSPIAISRQTDREIEDSNVRQIKFFDSDAKPSWRRYGKGTTTVDVSVPLSGNYLSLSIKETAFPAIGSEKFVTRDAYATLDGPAARALYEMLRGIFGFRVDAKLIDLEIKARQMPFTEISSEITESDSIGVKFCRNHAPGDKFVYTHNGVPVDRERVVELTGAPHDA